MPIYVFRCPRCGAEDELERSVKDRNKPVLCNLCGDDAERVYGQVNFARSSVRDETHFNHTVGGVVRNAKEFEDRIKRMNEEQGTHYAAADPRDVGATDEGLDSTMRRMTETGEREAAKFL